MANALKRGKKAFDGFISSYWYMENLRNGTLALTSPLLLFER